MTRTGPLSETQLTQYAQDGYLLEHSLFDAEEMQMLGSAAHADRAFNEHAMDRRDGEGGTVRLSVWNEPGDAIYGMVARCRRVVDRVEQLLEDEAYHYHSKMIMKDAQTGGAWAWHQDYGYWYHNGVLWPRMCSVFIAVDAATRENGCLQVLKASHKLGRIDHVVTGDQAGADAEHVREATKRLETIYCEMQPGDALFFHCNLLHRSDQNHSPHSRWSMVCCYNARSNDPFKESRHPRYSQLAKVEDEMVKQAGAAAHDASALTFLNGQHSTASQLDAHKDRMQGRQ